MQVDFGIDYDAKDDMPDDHKYNLEMDSALYKVEEEEDESGYTPAYTKMVYQIRLLHPK